MADNDPLAATWQLLTTDAAQAERQAAAFLQTHPGSFAALVLLGAARRRRGHVSAARDVLEPLTRQSADATLHHEWALLLAAMGQEAVSISVLRRLVARQPGLSASWRALGDLLILEGDGAGADISYRQAIRARVQAPHLAAATALCDGHATQAEHMLKAQARASPHDVIAIWMLAEAAIRVGKLTEAEAVLAHCLELAPDFADATHCLAILVYMQGRWPTAVPHMQRLLQLDPHESSWRKLLAVSLVRGGNYAPAVPLYEAMLTDYREQPKIWLQYAHALKTLGRVDDAVAAYRTCIGLAPGAAAPYLSLADVKTASFTDAEILAMRLQLRRATQATREDRGEAARMHYALGGALEQRGEFAESFVQYALGARTWRGQIAYDPDATSARMAESRALFTPEFFAARHGVGCESDAPIFVVGLPRSGSTLVEQILASHSAIEATTELPELGAIVQVLRDRGTDYAGTIAMLDRDTLLRMGERYLARTKNYRWLGRRYFIDKTPDNFQHIGLIRLMLPNARIVDVRRGPMAAGFAVFKQFFETGENFSYDLAEIGRYTSDYIGLMAHFDAVLPGRIHRVQYENLVDNTEYETRALLAYCGLPFEQSCLRFWETERAVQTPSAQQVRRPIYRQALDHWRKYEGWLEPLRKALK